MIVTLLLLFDVLVVAWLVYCIVREAKPGGLPDLGFLAYHDQLDVPAVKQKR